jgi:hypothetical protein
MFAEFRYFAQKLEVIRTDLAIPKTFYVQLIEAECIMFKILKKSMLEVHQPIGAEIFV